MVVVDDVDCDRKQDPRVLHNIRCRHAKRTLTTHPHPIVSSLHLLGSAYGPGRLSLTHFQAAEGISFARSSNSRGLRAGLRALRSE